MKVIFTIPIILASLFTYAEYYYRSKDYISFDLKLRKIRYEQLKSIHSIDSLVLFIDSIRTSQLPDEHYDNTISYNNHLWCADFLRLLGYLTSNDTIYIYTLPHYARFYQFQLDSILKWYKDNRNRIDVDSLRYLLSIQDRVFHPSVKWLFNKEYQKSFFCDSIKDSDSRDKLYKLLLLDCANWLKLRSDDKLFIDSIIKRFPNEKLIIEKLENDSAEYIYESMKGKWR